MVLKIAILICSLIGPAMQAAHRNTVTVDLVAFPCGHLRDAAHSPRHDHHQSPLGWCADDLLLPLQPISTLDDEQDPAEDEPQNALPMAWRQASVNHPFATIFEADLTPRSTHFLGWCAPLRC